MRPIGYTTYEADVIRAVIDSILSGREPLIGDRLAHDRTGLMNLRDRLPAVRETAEMWYIKKVEWQAEITHLYAKIASLERDLEYAKNMAVVSEEAVIRLTTAIEDALAALPADRQDSDDGSNGR